MADSDDAWDEIIEALRTVTTREDLGRQLRALRTASGRNPTQGEISRRTKASGPSVSEWFSGHTAPTKNWLGYERLLKLLLEGQTPARTQAVVDAFKAAVDRIAGVHTERLRASAAALKKKPDTSSPEPGRHGPEAPVPPKDETVALLPAQPPALTESDSAAEPGVDGADRERGESTEETNPGPVHSAPPPTTRNPGTNGRSTPHGPFRRKRPARTPRRWLVLLTGSLAMAALATIASVISLSGGPSDSSDSKSPGGRGAAEMPVSTSPSGPVSPISNAPAESPTAPRPSPTTPSGAPSAEDTAVPTAPPKNTSPVLAGPPVPGAILSADCTTETGPSHAAWPVQGDNGDGGWSGYEDVETHRLEADNQSLGAFKLSRANRNDETYYWANGWTAVDRSVAQTVLILNWETDDGRTAGTCKRTLSRTSYWHDTIAVPRHIDGSWVKYQACQDTLGRASTCTGWW